MTKIEELAAVLIDEIETFKSAIETLKKENEKIKTTKFTIDSSLIDNKYAHVINAISKSYKQQYQQTVKLHDKLNKAIVLPKWIFVMFSSFCMLLLVSLYVIANQHSTSLNNKEAAYNKGKEDISNYMQVFFKDHPMSLKKYQEWSKNKRHE